MKTLSRFVLLYTLCSLCTIEAMHNNNNNNNPEPDKATTGFKHSPRSPHQEKRLLRSSTEILCINAKTLATQARKKRATIIDFSRKQLDIKIQLLTAEKQIERQIELLKTVTEENKTAAKEQLKTYMTEAYIAICTAENLTPQEGILTEQEHISLAAEQPDQYLALADLAEMHAAVEKNREKIEDLEPQAYVDSVEIPLSPRAQKLHALIQDLLDTMQDRPGTAYEICLAQLQQHAKLLFSKISDENNETLHRGITEVSKRGLTSAYLVFTAMLECGTEAGLINRNLIFNGKTILDAAIATGNDMLVQLLTTEHPNKETLIALAIDHDKQELLHYLLG